MKIDVVFSGGGVKAYSFIGALNSIEKRELKLERLAGTSAGAIVASFLAAGYRQEEIKVMLHELDLKQLLDPPKLSRVIPFSKWLFLYFQMGLYKGNKFEAWLNEQLALKSIHTFKDLKEGYLKVVVSDLTLGRMVVIPDDMQRIYGIDPNDFPVSKAVRMSAGFPYFFMPKYIAGKAKEKSLIVDGGLLSNFPLWVFEHTEKQNTRPILGVKLSESLEQTKPRKIKNAFDMLHGLFSTMKQAHDSRYISKSHKDNIIFIPVEDIEATDFSISEQTKKELIRAGQYHAEQFLKFWPM